MEDLIKHGSDRLVICECTVHVVVIKFELVDVKVCLYLEHFV
jgi:hypothetical protein